MKKLRCLSRLAVGMCFVFSLTVSAGGTISVAVWCDGFPSCGTNGTPGFLNGLPGVTATVVTSAQLEMPGFLDAFQAIFVTRFSDAFGSGMSIAAAGHVRSYVRPDDPVDRGYVVLFPGDWCDNLPTSMVGNPEDPNVTQFVENAVRYAAVSGHGFVGEFNGAVMGVTINDPGLQTLALLPGHATPVMLFDPALNVVTSTGFGDPSLTTMVPDSYVGIDVTTWRTTVSTVPAENVVARFADDVPAVIANLP